MDDTIEVSLGVSVGGLVCIRIPARGMADPIPGGAVPEGDSGMEAGLEMKVSATQRGFGIVMYESWPSKEPKRLVQESSLVGEADDALSRPGSSYLWFGDDHHLNREEVLELIAILTSWVETGRLAGE